KVLLSALQQLRYFLAPERSPKPETRPKSARKRSGWLVSACRLTRATARGSRVLRRPNLGTKLRSPFRLPEFRLPDTRNIYPKNEALNYRCRTIDSGRR